MTDLVLAECHLPESPVKPGYYHEVTSGTPAAGLVISVSNDGEHKSSRNLTFISYDSACMTCNVTTGCVLRVSAVWHQANQSLGLIRIFSFSIPSRFPRRPSIAFGKDPSSFLSACDPYFRYAR